MVLVKKANPQDDIFVPLPSLPPAAPTSLSPKPSTTPTPTYVSTAEAVSSTHEPIWTTTAVPYTSTAGPFDPKENMAEDGTARLLSWSPPSADKANAVPVMTLHGPTPSPMTTPTPITTNAPIVVLSRQRFIPHHETLFVTPSSASGKKWSRITTTPAAIVPMELTNSPASISSTGVPASGNIPRSWTINSYDPRRNRISSRQDNDHHTLFFTTPPETKPRPAFVTPLPKKSSTTSTLATESKSGHPPTSEALIAQLRRDYKKRRTLIEKQSAVRRSDFSGPTVIPKSTSTTTEYTKGPSIRFEVVPEAQDRQYVVTTTPYTTSYLPPITTESHAYKEVHYVENDPGYSTTTAAPSTSLYSSPPTTATPLLHPPPPTSLTPPFQSQPATVYTVRPTEPTSSTSLITTQGALLLPKQKVPTFVTPIHSPLGLRHALQGKAAPAIIIVQQPQQPVTVQKSEEKLGQEAKTTEPPRPITTTPMSTTSTTTTTTTTVTPSSSIEDSSIVFPQPQTTLGSLTKYDEIEITESIGRNGGEVVFNDTQIDRGVQQSINLKINVIVENDSKEESEDYVDSIPKASTSPSIPFKNGVVKLAPLTYTSSNSFRSKEPAAATPNDYMYDSELDLEYYMYYDDEVYDDENVPEVWTEPQGPPLHTDSQNNAGGGSARPSNGNGSGSSQKSGEFKIKTKAALQQKQNLRKVELTDSELFELYDDLSEILEDMEASLAKPKPKLHSRPTVGGNSNGIVRDEKKQNIYEFIRSKPLKMPKKMTKTKHLPMLEVTRSPWTSPEASFEVNSASHDPARPSTSNGSGSFGEHAPIKTKPNFKGRHRKRRRKNYLRMEYPLASVKTYGSYPKTTMAPKSYYNLSSEDLIPDLRGVSKPSNWNVRDFTQWENIFYPRLGVIPSTKITPELDPARPRRPQGSRPEKQRKVTFDTLLKTNPRQISKFSRLIQPDKRDRRRRIDDYDYFNGPQDDYEVVEADEHDEPWTQYSTYTRMPRDSFYREESALSPMPRFQITFDEWLAEAGVTSSPHWHRRRRRRRRRR